MKQNLYFYGLILLTAIFVAHGLLTSNQWSLITAGCMGVLAYREKVGSRPGAPHAEEVDACFGSKEHQALYIRALDQCTKRIAINRALWRNVPLGAMNDEAYEKYDNSKWTYSLLFDRYEKARKEYGWKTQV